MLRPNPQHACDQDAASFRIPVISRAAASIRALRRWTSRTYWVRRLLGAPIAPGSNTDGLFLIQIDGLSRSQLESALRHHKMPFLRRLLGREGYELHDHYSGLPSTTAAVQAELFYGVRAAVPAHGFVDRAAGKLVTMLDNGRAAAVQKQITDERSGLMHDGSAYCNIYTGGAEEAHFCAAGLGWGNLFHGSSIWKIFIVMLLHVGMLLRAVGHGLVELLLAVSDCLRGISNLKETYEELIFIPSRVGVAILLREMMTLSASVDAIRGLPVIQMNFLGYDEHAHRRGPDSKFAQWTLRGIDRSIRRVWKAAMHSDRRQYRVWIYSDHGQQRVTPYDVATGRLFTEVVQEVFHPCFNGRVSRSAAPRRSTALRHAPYPKPRSREADESAATEIAEREVQVAAIGALGHIYLPGALADEPLGEACRKLAREHAVPLVVARAADGRLLAWTSDGDFQLPDDAARIFGADHPFLDQVTHDLIRVCDHPDAGEVVVAGWRHGAKPVSFVYEHGSHGGASPEETGGFVLLPAGTALPTAPGDPLRPDQLRAAALHQLERGASRTAFPRRRARRDTLRVMTYNVHCCVGLDGRLSLSRVASVLAQCDADIIALQELDVGRQRSGYLDQAQELADRLEMKVHFHPAFTVASEAYGDAILSRLPMCMVKSAPLPGRTLLPTSEQRGALWVEIDLGETRLQVLNTHLGLRAVERAEQLDALLGPEWLGHPDCRDPIVFCGDFNAGPRSPLYRRLTSRLRDVQLQVRGYRPRGTWLSTIPCLRIDHLFVSPHVEVHAVEIPRSHLIGIASDHLPLLADLRPTSAAEG